MRHLLLGFALLVVAVVGVAGFRGGLSRRPPIEIFPDMDRQPKLRPQTHSTFFADGLSSRTHLEGTIARSQPIRVGDQAFHPWQDAPVITGREPGTTNYVAHNPLPVSAVLLERGRQRFTINCSPCHGQLADGNGIPRKIGAMGVVGNLHDKRIVQQTDGELFHVISEGRNQMQGYAASIEIPDRWAIVAYVRALQLARLATLEDVPEPARAALTK